LAYQYYFGDFFPRLSVAFLPGALIDPVYRPLANPAALAFFLFIILSTLRLNPALCRLSGLSAAMSYLAAAAHLGWKPAISGGTSLLSPERAVFSYAITFVVAGFVSGMVAAEIRKQVDAALREAKTQRQVDRLEHDLELARSIQRSLLPGTMPEIVGFQIAGWNQPADHTGGDYYDWQLLPDGTVVLATDGFFEWENSQGESFGTHRLEEAIRKSKDKVPQELISDLYQAVVDFSGGRKQQDDLTAVIIKRTSGSSSGRTVLESASCGSRRIIAVN